MMSLIIRKFATLGSLGVFMLGLALFTPKNAMANCDEFKDGSKEHKSCIEDMKAYLQDEKSDWREGRQEIREAKRERRKKRRKYNKKVRIKSRRAGRAAGYKAKVKCKEAGGNVFQCAKARRSAKRARKANYKLKNLKGMSDGKRKRLTNRRDRNRKRRNKVKNKLGF